MAFSQQPKAAMRLLPQKFPLDLKWKLGEVAQRLKTGIYSMRASFGVLNKKSLHGLES